MYFRPFSYRFDGVFARNSQAWYTRDDGLIGHVGEDERRLVPRTPREIDWIWMEGPRENHILEPLDPSAGEWDQPATSSTNTETPLGSDTTVAVCEATEVITQTFHAGPVAIAASWSIYAKAVDSWGLVYPNVVNGIPSSTIDVQVNPVVWTRVVRKNVSLSAAGDKQAQLECDIDTAVWGAQAETGPGFAEHARFPSQPILLQEYVREGESLLIGEVPKAWLNTNGGVTGIRMVIEPDFASADVVSGDAFVFVGFDSGDANTSLVLWLEGTGTGAVRARMGYVTGDFVASGSLTFEAGQRLELIGGFGDPLAIGTGSLTVIGATTGNGTFIDGNFALVQSSAIHVGSLAGAAYAYGLLSPLELTFAGFAFGTVDQLTLNSIRVTFEDYLGPVDVLQFNPRGLLDALNPANYIIGGSEGLPHVQHVQPGAVGSEVVLFFDDTIAPGSTVRISPRNIVLAGSVPVTIEQGAPGLCDLAADSTTGLDTVLETVVHDEGTVAALFSVLEWAGDPLERPGVAGVEIVTDDPVAFVIRYWYIAQESTVADMEAALEMIAGHLVRVHIPGSLHVFDTGDDLEDLDFHNGQSPPVAELIAFGAEVNVAAQKLATYPRVDIANPQTEKDAPQGAALGTFPVTDTGDLANDHGRAYLRKRIFRRLSTFKHGFFHLRGYGFQPPSKRLLTPTEIRRLQVDVEAQVRQEPGVVAARAAVAEVRPGVVAVKLRIQDDNGSFELEGTLDFTAE